MRREAWAAMAAFVAGVVLVAGGWAGAARPPEPLTLPVQNDQAIEASLVREAERLIDAGRTTKAADLAAQLARATRPAKADLTPPPASPIDDADYYDRVRAGVLVVAGIYKCDKCSRWHAAPASGFVIDASGVAVTNYHVVDQPKHEAIVARTADGKVLPVSKVLAASKADDVAIVQLDLDVEKAGGAAAAPAPAAAKLTPLPLSAGAPVGSRVRIVSHPDQRFYMMTEGTVARYYAIRGAGGKPTGAVGMAVTAEYAKGSSGGPVLDEKGAVVGLVSSTQSIYYNQNPRSGAAENFQMTVRQCVPVAAVLKLLAK